MVYILAAKPSIVFFAKTRELFWLFSMISSHSIFIPEFLFSSHSTHSYFSMGPQKYMFIELPWLPKVLSKDSNWAKQYSCALLKHNVLLLGLQFLHYFSRFYHLHSQSLLFPMLCTIFQNCILVILLHRCWGGVHTVT